MLKLKPKIVVIVALAAATACREEPLNPLVGREVGTQAGYEAMQEQASVTGSPRDRDAIQQIVTTFDVAWTAGDAVTYAGQYADATWVGPTGAVVTDPAALTGLYTAILTFGLPGTTRMSTIRSLTFLTGTLAVLDIDARVTGFINPPPGIVPWQPGTLRVLEKNIVQKRAGEWRIIQHQQTPVAPGN